MSIAHSIKDTVRTDDVLITESVDFSGLLLSKHVLQGLTEAGFKRPSPIQLKAIPLGRCGLDLIVQAKSGTGKTCVFTVVALEGLELKSICVQVLVLAPTREIALQIQDVIQTVGKPMRGLKCHCFIGGLPLEVDKSVAKSCHIAVGTPGRVKQLIEIGALKTNSVRMFILDEADKLLEEGFQDTINWIYATLPRNKQILALSATYPEQLAQHLTSYMRNPTFVRLNISDPALLGIKQYHYVVANHPMPNVVFSSKIDAVVKILTSVSFQQCLIFSNLQTGAQNLQSELVSRNWPTTCIAGFLGQKERNLAMEQLKTYKCRILISTDLTSRGIDADKVNLVINLDVPLDHETYLHRIGRAGRYGSFGAAVTIVTKGAQETQLWAVEKKCRTYIHKLPDPIPNDLVTKPVPLRIDDIVSTEQIINQPASEMEAPVDSNYYQKAVSLSDNHIVTQSSEQNRQASDEKVLSAEAESVWATERDTALKCEMHAELPKPVLLELPDEHISDTKPSVGEEGNHNSIHEPGPLSLHETANVCGDFSHSSTDVEFKHEITDEKIGMSRHEILAENSDICMQEATSDHDNGSFEILRENCNECKCETSTGACSNCRHHSCPDNSLEARVCAVSVQASEDKNSVKCKKTPAVQIDTSTLNVHGDLVDVSQSNEDISDDCTDFEPKLVVCLQTGHHESVSTVEFDSGLASLEIVVKCEEDVQLLQTKANNINLENNGSCKVQHHSSIDFEENGSGSLGDECKPVLPVDITEEKCGSVCDVLPTDTREENKARIIRTDISECSKDSDVPSSLGTLVNVLHTCESVERVASVFTSANIKAESACPSVDANVGGPLVDASIRGPSIDANVGGPSVDANVGGPSVDASVGGPSVDASVGGPSVDASVGGPSVDANVGGPSVDASVGGPSVDASVGSPSVDAGVGGPSVDANIDGPSVDSNVSGPSVDANVRGPSVDASVDGPSVDASVDDLVSDKVLMVCSDISDTQSDAKEACYTHSCNNVSEEVGLSSATLNAEDVSNGDNVINASESPALAIPDKCNYSKMSGEISQAENKLMASSHSQDRLPVKFRKPGTRRKYLKPFAVSEFLQFVNESNSFPNCEETSYPVNDPDETSYPVNDPDEDCNDTGFPADTGSALQDSMPCGLKAGGDFAASCVLSSRPHVMCEVSLDEVVVNDNKTSSHLHVDVLAGGDCIGFNVVGTNFVDSCRYPSRDLHVKSGHISEGDLLDENISDSHISLPGLEQHVEHIQPSNVENGMCDTTDNIVNEPANDSVTQTVCNSLAPSQVSSKSMNILLIDYLSSLLPSQSDNQLPRFADLEADYQKFCCDFDSSVTVSCASELTKNLLLEDFADSKDVQELCAVECTKLTLLKSELKGKLLTAEEKRKADIPIEERLKLREGCAGDKQAHQINKHSGEKSVQSHDETVHKKQKSKQGYKGRNKSGRGRKGSDSLNWRSAADGQIDEKSLGESRYVSPRKEVQKQRTPKKNRNSKVNEDVTQVMWKRECSGVDMSLDSRIASVDVAAVSSDDPTLNPSQLTERPGDMLGKHERKANKLNRQDDTTVNENTIGENDENAKQEQEKPSGRKDDECKMLDNMHAQMLLKRKLRKLEREQFSGGGMQSNSCAAEVTITENAKEEDDENAKQKHAKPSERRDDECKMLDNMHSQMLLKRKLRKLERQHLSGDVQSNSCAAEVTKLNEDEEAKILDTVDKGTEDFNASKYKKKTPECEESNRLLDIEHSVILEVMSNTENTNSVCEGNQTPKSNPGISKEDESQVADNLISSNTTISEEQGKQKSTGRDKLVKFKLVSDSLPGHRKPTKPSKTEARLAGIEVSDGSTSSTSDLSLSSASDISDVNSSDVDTKDIILASQCYANKYAQEGYIDPRFGRSNKKEATKKVPSHSTICTQRDGSLQDSASRPETENLQHSVYPSGAYLIPTMSSMSLQDSDSTVLPSDNRVHHPSIIEHSLPVKSGLKSKQMKHRLAEHSKYQHVGETNSAGRKTSEEHKRAKIHAKDCKLNRNSRNNQTVVRHSDEFRGSDSEDISSYSSESGSHPFITHHPNLYSYPNVMPWFPSYCNMPTSVQQHGYPTSSYVSVMQPLSSPYYGPQTIHPSYPHPPLHQSRQPLSAYNYPQPVFQWHTPSSQTMWYYVSHMTNMLSHLLRKHRREMESLSENNE